MQRYNGLAESDADNGNCVAEGKEVPGCQMPLQRLVVVVGRRRRYENGSRGSGVRRVIWQVSKPLVTKRDAGSIWRAIRRFFLADLELSEAVQQVRGSTLLQDGGIDAKRGPGIRVAFGVNVNEAVASSEP
jgi:hypothetical protein